MRLGPQTPGVQLEPRKLLSLSFRLEDRKHLPLLILRLLWESSTFTRDFSFPSTLSAVKVAGKFAFLVLTEFHYVNHPVCRKERNHYEMGGLMQLS